MDARALSVGDEFDTHPAPYPTTPRRGYVTRVVDGDTYFVKIDKGEHDTSTVEIRLRGVNSPELATPEGVQAAKAVATFCLGRPVLVTTYKDRRSFVRYIADLEVWDGTGWVNLAGWMLEQGWAEKYRG